MKKIKLNIQLFSDSDVDIDTGIIIEVATQLGEIAGHVYETLKTIASDVLKLQENQSFLSIAGTILQEKIADISPYFENYQTVVSDLGKFLGYVVSTYQTNDEEIKKEFEAWGNTVATAVEKIKSGLTEVSSNYTATQYVSDLSTSTKVIVGEVSNMIANTGKLYSSATGKSVLTSVQDLGSIAVGSFGKLLAGGAETATKFLGFFTGGIA